MFEINWSPNDLKALNCLKVLASLPPFVYIPGIYTVKSLKDPNALKYMYKLQSLICYTGNHYLTIMRVATKMSNYQKQWTLLNDSEIKLFADMNEVITYCVEAGACPTVIIYEKVELVQGVTFEQSKKI